MGGINVFFKLIQKYVEVSFIRRVNGVIILLNFLFFFRLLSNILHLNFAYYDLPRIYKQQLKWRMKADLIYSP